MSEKKGAGLFVSSKAGQSAASAAPVGGGVQKNVKRRWLIVGGGVIVVAMVVSTLLAPSKEQGGPQRAAPNQGMVSVNPPKAEERLFQEDYRKRLEQMEARMNSLSADNDRKTRELENARRQMEDQSKPATPGGTAPVVLPPTMNGGGLNVIGGTGGPPPPPVPPVPTQPTFKPPTLSPAGTSGAVPTLPALPGAPAEPDGPLVFDAPGQSASSGGAGSSSPARAASGTGARATMQKNANAGLLPAGAFAPMALLNGLDAGTSSSTQSNPMPILLNLTDQATLPGAAKYRLRNCFVLATAYGDLSAERVYGRISRLSCVDKQDKLVLSQEVSGYLVDSDGKLGLRGVVTNRQGAKLHTATLAGFAQGLAGALGQAQGSVTNNLTTGMSSSSLSGAAALRSSGLMGAQSATNQLAEFYLKEAQSLFPVITVDAGRTGSVVFTGSVPLNWGNSEGAYVQQVQPTNTN